MEKESRKVEHLNFDGKKIILYQGVMNPGRGLEEMIAAMPFVENAILLIIGFGKVEENFRGKPSFFGDRKRVPGMPYIVTATK